MIAVAAAATVAVAAAHYVLEVLAKMIYTLSPTQPPHAPPHPHYVIG